MKQRYAGGASWASKVCAAQVACVREALDHGATLADGFERHTVEKYIATIV